jgi:hypothetical protein
MADWRGIPNGGYWRPEKKAKTLEEINKQIARAEKYKSIASPPGERKGLRGTHFDGVLRSLRDQRETITAKPSTGERAYKTGMNVGAVVIGGTVGHMLAENINTRHQASIAARNPQAKELARMSSGGAKDIKISGKEGHAARQLRAAARVNSNLGLARAKGPAGLGLAAILALEGAFSRFVLAPQARKDGNETAAEALSATGTVAAFAATGLLGSRAIHNATLTKYPDAKHAAIIEKGRMIADKALQEVSSTRLVHAERVKRDALKLMSGPGGMARPKGRAAMLAAGIAGFAAGAYALVTRNSSSEAKPARAPAYNPRARTGKVVPPTRKPSQKVPYRIKTGKRKGQVIQVTQGQKQAYEGR